MANNVTQSISINKNSWVKIASAGEQFFATPPENTKEYKIFYVFAASLPDPSLFVPSHRYSQAGDSEGFVSGSESTANCYARLSSNSLEPSVDLYVTIISDAPAS